MDAYSNFFDQYDRVMRHYQRLENIRNGKDLGSGGFSSHDAVLDFFMNCHHLKDWLKNDEQIPQENKKDIDLFINQNPCLCYCADIANGAKHLALDRKRSSVPIDKDFKRIALNLDEGGNIKNVRIFFLIDGKEIDTFELAMECVQKWRDYINSKLSLFQTNAIKS